MTAPTALGALDVDHAGGHSPALLDQLSRGQCKRTCRRVTSLLISAAIVVPLLGALGFYCILPLVHRFGQRAQHEMPSRPPSQLTPVDFKPYFPVDNPGQWTLLVLLSLACFFNLLIAGSTFLLFMRRRFKQLFQCQPGSRARQAGLREQLLLQPVTAVVPCYLPNEQSIITETIDHILTNVAHDGVLTLHIVYNTPTELPIEAELRDRAATQRGVPPGRRLVVQKVEGSRSKAENLNAAFETIGDEVTAIYDADHHPDPGSLALMLRKLQNHQVDCVQGSTYIRNTSSGLMGRVIDAEFFVTYFIYFMSLQFIARTGFFGGSNAVWRTTALREDKFSADMQTEDIEFATRAILKDKRIRFCPEARSGELAPSTFSALYRQRLRWAMGWEQVTLHHLSSVARSRVGCGRKLGLLYMLPMRWLLAFLSVVGAIVTPILCLIYPPSIWPLALDFLFTLGFLESSVLVACTLLESIYHEAFVQCIFVAAFMLCSPAYLCVQVSMLLASLWRISTGRTGSWVVTARSGDTNGSGAAARDGALAAGGAALSRTRPTTAASNGFPGAPAPERPTSSMLPAVAGDLEEGRDRVAPVICRTRHVPMAGLERYYAADMDSTPHAVPALGSMRHTL